MNEVDVKLTCKWHNNKKDCKEFVFIVLFQFKVVQMSRVVQIPTQNHLSI